MNLDAERWSKGQDLAERLRLGLAKAGKGPWLGPLTSWVHPYRGLEQFTDETESPMEQLVGYVESVSAGTSQSEFAAALTKLPFLTWRIRHNPVTTLWDPATESLEDFLAQSTAAWSIELTVAESEAIAAKLLGQVLAQPLKHA